MIGGQRLKSSVDLPVAQYYLNHYLAGERLHREFDRRIGLLYRDAGNPMPNRDELKKLSEDFSPDFAALYFADRLSRSKKHKEFQEYYNRVLNEIRPLVKQDKIALPAAAAKYQVLFVPGFLYQRNPLTGADFARPREALEEIGLQHRFVETDEDGPIEANAVRIAAAIAMSKQDGRRLIVVSASKSGPEVALALSRLDPKKNGHVAAWVNLVGTMQGSPLADDQLWRDVDHLVGPVDPDGVRSLTTESSRRRFSALRLPAGLFVVNYIGIPVSGSLSYLSRKGYREIIDQGPNDGLSLLPDLLAPGGVTLMELGSDHFLLRHDIEATTIALAITLIRWLEEHKHLLSRSDLE